MSISCSSLVCPIEEFSTIDEIVRHIDKLGFKAIDLAAFEGWQSVNPSWLTEHYDDWTQTFEDALAETGMRVSSINTRPRIVDITDPDPASFEAYKKDYATILKLAKQVNCSSITIQPGKMEEGETFDTTFERAKQRFLALAELHDGGPITLNLEGHYGSLLESPDAALRMMQAVWPKVGLTYDPSHFTMQGIALKDTEPLLAYTQQVHVRNASLGNMQDTMENGLVDIPWLISALQARAYDGSIAVEYFEGFDRDFTNTRAMHTLLLELLGVA